MLYGIMTEMVLLDIAGRRQQSLVILVQGQDKLCLPLLLKNNLF